MKRCCGHKANVRQQSAACNAEHCFIYLLFIFLVLTHDPHHGQSKEHKGRKILSDNAPQG